MNLKNGVLLVDPLMRRKHQGMLDDFGMKYDIPYGLLAVASYLQKRGIQTGIISMDFETRHGETDENVLRMKRIKKKSS